MAARTDVQKVRAATLPFFTTKKVNLGLSRSSPSFQQTTSPGAAAVSMKKNIFRLILLGYISLILSCSDKKLPPSQKQLVCDDCLTFKVYILENWALDSSGYFHFKNAPVCEGPDYIKPGLRYPGLMGHKCFKGQPIDSVLYYFGQPSVKINNRFDYYMTAKCHGKARGDKPNIPGCIRLQIYFDENKKVVGVSGMMRE